MSTRSTSPRSLLSRLRGDRRGAAMLVVMMVLLVTTATATFAIHSTSYEIRAAGYSRHSMQTQYLAEGGLIAAMSVIETRMQALDENMVEVVTPTRIAPEEPFLASGARYYPLSMDDFTRIPGSVGAPLEMDPLAVPSLGAGQAYTGEFYVDITDSHASAHVQAGRRSDGSATERYSALTITSRGRMSPPTESDASDPHRLTDTTHQVAVNSRGFALVPFQ